MKIKSIDGEVLIYLESGIDYNDQYTLVDLLNKYLQRDWKLAAYTDVFFILCRKYAQFFKKPQYIKVAISDSNRLRADYLLSNGWEATGCSYPYEPVSLLTLFPKETCDSIRSGREPKIETTYYEE